MTPFRCVDFQVSVSYAENEANTCSIADIDHVVNPVESVRYDITMNGQMPVRKEFTIRSIVFETWWGAIGIQMVWKTIEQGIVHFGCCKIHPVTHMAEAIQWIGSGENITTDIAGPVHISNVNETYRSLN